MSTKAERAEVYNTPRWAALRRRVRERDGYLCQRCKENGLTGPAEIVHHVRPIRDGGDPFDLENLISVCRPCHEELHEAEKPKKPEIPGARDWRERVNTLGGTGYVAK